MLEQEEGQEQSVIHPTEIQASQNHASRTGARDVSSPVRILHDSDFHFWNGPGQ